MCHRNCYKDKKSMEAHSAIGFEFINTYRDDLDEWNIVILDLS